MKKLIVVLSIVSLITAACGAGEKGGTEQDAKLKQQQSELEELKKQEAEIKSKIAALEAEIKSVSKDSVLGTAVSVISMKAEIFNNYIDIQGRVDADENVSISTEMPGTITKINVQPGDEVSVGQVLAETDSRAINQQKLDLETNAQLIKQVYDKQKALWDQKIGTEVQYLQAKTNYESMQNKLASLQEQIRMSKIISPINGTVDAVDIKLGQSVAPGMPAIRVINFANLKIKADVSETYASKIKKGSDVIVYFPDLKDSLVAKVNFVSRAINPATRTFNVDVLLDNKKEYHPNMVAKLSINDYRSTTPQIIVPVRTIQKDETNQSFVFIADGNVVKKQIVTIGKEYNGKAEILSGLKEGDKIVTLGYDIVNTGDTIVY